MPLIPDSEAHFNVLNLKSLYFGCHSGLDPESRISELDFRWSLPRTRYGAGMTA